MQFCHSATFEYWFHSTNAWKRHKRRHQSNFEFELFLEIQPKLFLQSCLAWISAWMTQSVYYERIKPTEAPSLLANRLERECHMFAYDACAKAKAIIELCVFARHFLWFLSYLGANYCRQWQSDRIEQSFQFSAQIYVFCCKGRRLSWTHLSLFAIAPNVVDEQLESHPHPYWMNW